MLLLSFLQWGGVSCCSIGGLLALVGVAKGRQARELSTATQVENLAELKQLFALVPILIAVTGRVLAPKPYKCELSDSDAAIVELWEEKKSERRASATVWVGDSQLLRESRKESEWALADATGTQLPVQGGLRAEGDFLQMSGDRLIPENRGTAGRLAEEILGSRTLGVRQVERMLPVGTVLTAVGELSTAVEHPSAFKGAVRRGGKMLVLRQPRSGAPFLLSRQPLPELVASLQASSLACQRWATAFGALGVSMLVAAGTQHALAYLRRRRIRRRVEKALRDRAAARGPGGDGAAGAAAERRAAGQAAGDGQAAAAGGGGGGDGEVGGRGLCVVCLERPSDTVFPSCGHMCACSSCSGGLRRCPICRSRGAPIRVFTS